MEQDRPEAVAARERQAAMVEELPKAELVRDRLEGLQRLVAPEYEALADAVGYALDLADFAHAAQIQVFADLELPEDR